VCVSVCEKGDERDLETTTTVPLLSSITRARTVPSVAQQYKAFPLPLRLGSRILVFWEAGIGRGVGVGREIWSRSGGMGWIGWIGWICGKVEGGGGRGRGRGRGRGGRRRREEEEEEEEEEGGEVKMAGSGKEQCEGVGTRAPTRSSQ